MYNPAAAFSVARQAQAVKITVVVLRDPRLPAVIVGGDP